jgi:hypothetical protein
MEIDTSMSRGGFGNSETPGITQSGFFSPAFNAAIFDGPLRIYFAQYQEAEALKLYFKLQEKMKHEIKELRGQMKTTGFHVFVMLYPTAEIFARSFPRDGKSKAKDTAKNTTKSPMKRDSRIAFDRLGKDIVIGINGSVGDGDEDVIYALFQERFSGSTRKVITV